LKQRLLIEGAGATAAAADNSTTDPCAAGPLVDYTLGYHIAGVFIILAVSSLGIMSAIWLGTHKEYKNNQNIIALLQLLKFFGVGVVVSTAWCVSRTNFSVLCPHS